MSRLYKLIHNPQYIPLGLMQHGFFNWMTDETYLRFAFRLRIGKPLNLDCPTTYNEKLQWLKLNDRNADYTALVDKILVRDYVAEKLGEDYLIPLLGIWDNAEGIDFERLPERYVLKCNHDCGSVIVCDGKSDTDISKMRAELKKALKTNAYWYGREWPYKNVVPRIMAEQYLIDETTNDLFDYKVYCFDGEPKFVMVNAGRGRGETTANYYDLEYSQLPFAWGYPVAENLPKLPMSTYKEILWAAKNLSDGIPHVRVDFFVVNGKIYFGEMTFFDGSGFSKFTPNCWDEKIGQFLRITNQITSH